MARWYIIHAYSGFENKVRDAIISEAERLGLSEGVEEVEVPTETVTELKRGKKVQVERKFMPGYVLAKLNMTDDIYHLVKNTPKVTGFLGNNNKPQAISEKEAARYFGGVEEAKSAPKKDDKAKDKKRGGRGDGLSLAHKVGLGAALAVAVLIGSAHALKRASLCHGSKDAVALSQSGLSLSQLSGGERGVA